MSDWIISLEGTDAGARLAMALALLAGLMHATIGAMQKGKFDPWLMRGAVDTCAGVIAIPLVLFVVPVPSWDLAVLLPGVMLIHLVYKWVLAMAYTRGAFSAVYPIVRGIGPLATVLFAGVIFGEFFTAGQWAGIALLSGGIFGLAAFNLIRETIDRATLQVALALAVVTGLLTALYTVFDAYAIRIAKDPFTFVVWFFFLEMFLFPPLLGRRWRTASGQVVQLFRRGLAGAFVVYISFSAIFLATRLDKVGEAASLRETSVVFAAILGWLFLGERIGPTRTALMVIIAVGAVVVEFAG
ncbi:MAG: DMT family transporter [Pseudomonadota bacterium]